MSEPSRRFRFASFELDSRTGELRKAGFRVRLQDKPLRILEMLLERPGEVLTREELRLRLWPDTVVDFDHGLNNAVNRLREALSDSAEAPRFIETLARRGYRFIPPVERVPSPMAEGTPVRPTAASEAEALKPPPEAPALRRSASSRIVAGAALLLALAAVVGVVRARRAVSAAPAPARRAMLAVLPFRNLEGEPQQEYFSDGLTEETISALGQLRPQSLGVIARTSVMLYKHSEKRADQIGRELGVDYLLEGSVRASGERVRITAALIQARDETNLWSGSYDGTLGDVLSFQHQVARAVAEEISFTLTPQDEARLSRRGVASPEAYELYLKGRYQLNLRTEESLRKGLELFQQATSLAPDYAAAYAGLADAYVLLGAGAYTVMPPREAFPKAEAAARKALVLDESLAAAHATLGYVSYAYDWDWAAAELSFRHALAVDPNCAAAHHWYSLYLKSMGRRSEAVAEAKEALELDPLSLIMGADFAWTLFHARDFDGAIAQCHKVLDLDGRFPVAYWNLGLASEQKGRYPEAIAAFEKAIELAGRRPVYLGALGRSLALSGDIVGARRVLLELESLEKQRYVPSANVALVHLALGETDLGFVLLEQAFTERSDFFVNLKVDPRLDPVRSDPRLQDLLRRTGLQKF